MNRLLTRLFAIDLRSLAVFRVGLGVLLLVDLIIRATDLRAHYTDYGVVPRSLLAEQYAGTWAWSLHALNGSAAFQTMLFLLAGLAACGLVVGVMSRPASVISWILLASLHARNPLINNGGDVLLRSLSFWAMFLPLDAVWALRRRDAGSGDRRSVVSVASAAILLQVAIVYWISAYYKLHGVWQSADALQQIFSSDSYARPLARYLLGYPHLLRWLTLASLWSELLLPLLIFSPVGTQPIRILAVLWFILFHLGIQLTLTVGLFSFVCCLAWTLFVPGECWDWLSQAMGRAPEVTQSSERIEAAQVIRASGPKIALRSLLGMILIYVVIWNLTHLPGAWTTGIMPRSWKPWVDVLGLRQKWNLFQYAVRQDGWYVAPAWLNDGRVVDLLREGKPADWDSYRKPEWIYRRFPNHRWRKYYRNLVSDRFVRYREPLCHYLARQWRESHGDDARIESLELHYMEELGRDAGEQDRFQQRILHRFEVP